jgi:hypothetical protein
MLGSLLWRGMLAGLCAGILAFGFASVVGEPQVNTAISFEEQHARAAGEPTMPPLVPRDVQSTAGLFTGVALYGIAFGGLFALAFAAAFGRVRRASPSRTALWLAAGVFGVVVLVPGLKYPANPPAVGDPGTVGQRTLAYLTMLAAAVTLALAAWWASRALRARGVPDHVRLTVVAAGYTVAVALAYALWPANPDRIDVPATLLWRFRLASLGGAAALWSVLAAVFGWACVRAEATRPRAGRAAGRTTGGGR